MYLTQGGQIRSRKKTNKRSSKYASKKLNRNKYQKGGSSRRATRTGTEAERQDAERKQAGVAAKQAEKEAEICEKLFPEREFNALTNENKKKVVIDTIYYLCTLASTFKEILDPIYISINDGRSTVPECKINVTKEKILMKYIFSKDTHGVFKIKEGLMKSTYQDHFLNAMIGIIIESPKFNENNELSDACNKSLGVAKKSETTIEPIYEVPGKAGPPDSFNHIAYVVALLYLGIEAKLNKVAFENTNTDFETILGLFKASDKLTDGYKNAFIDYKCPELIEERARRNFENYKGLKHSSLAKYFLSNELGRLSKLNTQDSSTFSKEVLLEQGLYNYKLLLALHKNITDSKINDLIFTPIDNIDIIEFKKTIDYNKLLRDLISVIESNKETLEQLITYDSVCQDFMADQSSSADVSRIVRCLNAVKLFINANDDTIISKYTKDLFNLVCDKYIEKIKRGESIQGARRLKSTKGVRSVLTKEEQVSAEDTLIISEMLELMVKGYTPKTGTIEDYIRKIQALLVNESSLQLNIKRPKKKRNFFRNKIVMYSKNTTKPLEVHQKVLVGIITICKDFLSHFDSNITLDFNYCTQLEKILSKISYLDNFGIQFLSALNDTDTQTSASNIFAKMLGIDDVSFNFLLAQPIDSINLGKNVSKPVNNLRRNGGKGKNEFLDDNTNTVFEVFLKYLINKFEKSKNLYFLSVLGSENITRITEEIKSLNSGIEVKTISLPNSFILKNIDVVNIDKSAEIQSPEKRGRKLDSKTIGFELLIAHLLDLVNRITINRHLLEADAGKALQMISGAAPSKNTPQNQPQYMDVLKKSEIKSISELSTLFDDMKDSAPIFTTGFNEADYTKHKAELAALKSTNEPVFAFYQELFSFIPEQLTGQSGGMTVRALRNLPTPVPPLSPEPQPPTRTVFNFNKVPPSPTSPFPPTSPTSPTSPFPPTTPTSPSPPTLPKPVTQPTQYPPVQAVSVNSLQENKYLLVDIIEGIDQTKLHQFISKDIKGSNTILEQIDNHFDKVYLNVLIYLACYAHANLGTESISRTLDNKNIRMLVDLPEEKARNTEEDQAAARAQLEAQQKAAEEAAKWANQHAKFVNLTEQIEAEIERATDLNSVSVAVQTELDKPKEDNGKRRVSFGIVDKSGEIQGVKTNLDELSEVNEETIRKLNELLGKISALIDEIEAAKSIAEKERAERDAAVAAAVAKQKVEQEAAAAAAAAAVKQKVEQKEKSTDPTAAKQETAPVPDVTATAPISEEKFKKMLNELNRFIKYKQDTKNNIDLTEDLISQLEAEIKYYKQDLMAEGVSEEKLKEHKYELIISSC
mgnify:CR=1 FL=1